MESPMILGFTGTQHGMTLAQQRDFREYVSKFEVTTFHHGDCVGADAEAHDIVRSVWPHCKIVVHPPEKEDLRAFKQGEMVVVLAKKPYLVRNKDIVKA